MTNFDFARSLRSALLMVAAGAAAFAQNRPPAPDPEPVSRAEEAPPPAPAQAQPQPSPYGVPPAQVMLAAGTFIPVRINELLSSDRNRAGDGFSATLEQPLVADGIVVAHRGQMVYGRVVEAERAQPRQPSRLAVELTLFTLADGTQAPAKTALSNWQGGTAPGREQAGTVLGTTAAGAVIGGIAARGAGAAVGAGAGAAAGAAIVLLTRNRPTVVYPETALTFRLEAPLQVSTQRAPQAFRFADPAEFERPARVQPRQAAGPRCNGCAPPPPPYWGRPGYPYPGWGPYYGTGVGVVFGRARWRRW